MHGDRTHSVNTDLCVLLSYGWMWSYECLPWLPAHPGTVVGCSVPSQTLIGWTSLGYSGGCESSQACHVHVAK